MQIYVLFVCLGNICRSPTAHGLFQDKVNQANLNGKIIVDSAGTGSWHQGSPPDERTQATALSRGYDISSLKARQVKQRDFNTFDYILAMDLDNLHQLTLLKPDTYKGTLGLFLDVAGINHDNGQGLEVPDPYYGGREHFEKVLHLVETGAEALLERIRSEHGLENA